MKQKLLIVGAAGKQGREYFELLRNQFEITALVDTNIELLFEKYKSEKLPLFSSVEEAVIKKKVDVAIVAVPHAFHFEVTSTLLRKGIHVIKEKPFALNTDEAKALLELAEEFDKSIFVITQRNATRTFDLLVKNLSRIGQPHYFNYEFFMKLPSQTSGWRAQRDYSVGGVILDMGYHSVDVINRLFGEPDTIQVNCSYRYDEMLKENLEDSSLSVFKYKHLNLHGNLLLDRHSDKKHECLKIFGSAGKVEWQHHSFHLETFGGESIDYQEEKNLDHVRDQMFSYMSRIADKNYFRKQAAIHLKNVTVVNRMYEKSDQIFLPCKLTQFKSLVPKIFSDITKTYISNLNLIRS